MVLIVNYILATVLNFGLNMDFVLYTVESKEFQSWNDWIRI